MRPMDEVEGSDVVGPAVGSRVGGSCGWEPPGLASLY